MGFVHFMSYFSVIQSRVRRVLDVLHRTCTCTCTSWKYLDASDLTLPPHRQRLSLHFNVQSAHILISISINSASCPSLGQDSIKTQN